MVTIFDWLPNDPLSGPPVPRWMRSTWSQFRGVNRRELADLKNQVTGTPSVLPDLFYLTFKSISSAALDATISPGLLAKWEAALDEQIANAGKFTQFSVFYRDISPPPVFWDYKCFKCKKWGPNQGQPDRTCLWVADDISPEGWCAIWIPNTGYKAFSWPQELVAGNW